MLKTERFTPEIRNKARKLASAADNSVLEVLPRVLRKARKGIHPYVNGKIKTVSIHRTQITPSSI